MVFSQKAARSLKREKAERDHKYNAANKSNSFSVTICLKEPWLPHHCNLPKERPE